MREKGRRSKQRETVEKAEDERKMALITAQNECESLINSVKDSIEKDKDKLDADLITSANTEIEEAKKIIDSKDLDAISSAKQKLTEISNKIYEALSKANASDANENKDESKVEEPKDDGTSAAA